MTKKSTDRLQFLCDTIPDLLTAIDEQTFSSKSNPEKWSKKEIIGHLIDSAANNHHILVRGQFEQEPKITYDQNNWNKSNFYQQIDSKQIISFWTTYNKQLLELVKRIPNHKLENKVQTENLVRIQFLIDDYVAHIEHHLQQVITY
ncbi:MAG: hypothetical protein A3K10_06585 [Bacteroidetes bacterium RIFCSPLOWO2_12_FULL_31_6]|nr:MAG: hypothetical protein A3K10_06585 [Bacteroidetes bacterium RIFCSPLOWO2_12_FULL_31_6]